MDKKITEFSDDSLREIAKEIIIQRYALLGHIWLFIFINFLLGMINYLTNHFSNMWFFWPFLGWFIILGIHIVSFLIFKFGVINLQTVVINYHFTAYVLVNGFLVFANGFTSQFNPPWCIWPIAGWGVVLIGHFVVYTYIVPRKQHKGSRKSWLERQVEMEMDKLKTETENIINEKQIEAGK